MPRPIRHSNLQNTGIARRPAFTDQERAVSDVAGARVTLGVAVGRTLKWTVLGFFLVFTFVPLLWLVISSFKTNLELTTSPFALPDRDLPDARLAT